MTTTSIETRQKRRFPDRAKPTRTGNGALMDKYELAAALGESEKSVIYWTRNGVIPFIPCGPHTKRYSLDAVLRALSRRQVKATPPDYDNGHNPASA